MTEITIPISSIERLIKIAYTDGKLAGTAGASSDDYLKQESNVPVALLNQWIKINENEKATH